MRKIVLYKSNKESKITERQRRWCNRLRNCATSREVARSISDGINGIFIDTILPPDYALASNSTSYISWEVKAASA
jgi:hypothetical protein